MTSLLLEEDFTAGECTCFVCWGVGWGGGGDYPTIQGFGGFFRGGLAVRSLACWTLSERERRRPSRIACDNSFENDFLSSSSKSDSLVHVRDCTPSWVKELPGGVADDVIFPMAIRVVGPSEMGLLPVQVSNLVMAAVMASLLLSFPVGVTQPITSHQKNWRDFQQVKVARSTTTSQLPSLTFV